MSPAAHPVTPVARTVRRYAVRGFTSGRGIAPHGGPRRLGRHGEDDRERAASADLALDGDVAAHHPGEPAGEGETETDALARPVVPPELTEDVEDRLVMLARNAGAGVGDPDRHPFTVEACRGEADLAVLGELLRVGEQVLDDDAELGGLRGDRSQLLRHVGDVAD